MYKSNIIYNKIFYMLALLLALLFSQIVFYFSSDIKAFAQNNSIELTPLTLEGTGTYSTPYLVKSSADLNNLCAYTNSGGNTQGLYFKLTSADLTESGALEVALIEPIGTAHSPFMGVFDGNDITLTGATYSTNAQGQAGIFGQIKNATIQNLTVKYTSKETTATVMGGIVASAYSSNILNCTNKTNIYNTAGDAMVAGIVGYAYNLNIENCTNEASIKNETTQSVPAEKCVVGGIVGFGYNTNVTLCSNFDNISNSSNNNVYSGGIVGVGNSNTKVSQNFNYSTASISAQTTNKNYSSYAGGIVAYSGTVSDCFNRGNIVAKGVESDSTSKITIKNYGVKAANLSKYNESYYNRKVSTIKAYAGGISGGGTTISNSYNTGSVSGGNIKYTYDLNYILLYTKNTAIYGAPVVSGYAEYIKGTISIINKYNNDGIMPSNSSTNIYSTFNNICSDANFDLKSEFDCVYFTKTMQTENRAGTFTFKSSNCSYITKNMDGNTNGVVTKKTDGKYVLSAPFKDLKVYITYSSDKIILKHGYKSLKDSTYSAVYNDEQTDTIINESISRQGSKTNIISSSSIKSTKVDGSDKALPSGFSSSVWAYSSLINDGYPHLIKYYWQDKATI